MKNSYISRILAENSEAKYKDFASSLIPGLKMEMLGVRVPVLRKIADKIIKDDPLDFIENYREKYFEDIMLKGFVTAKINLPCKEKFELTAKFIPKIDNWSVCDSFCSSLKFVKNCREDFLAFLLPYFKSSREFEARFALVCLMEYYNNKEDIKRNLKILEDIVCDGYYCKTAFAWTLAEMYYVDSIEVYDFIKEKITDEFIRNTAVSKIKESNKIKKSEKERALRLKL